MSTHSALTFQRTAIASALLAVFVPAHAEGEDVAALINPSSSISVGVGGASGNSSDRAFFGQYNGFRKNSGQLLLDVDYVKRDNPTGTWTTFSASNLGSENRELGFSQQNQGDWKYRFEYGELVRNYSNTINTRLQGIGTSNLLVTSVGSPPVAGAAASPTALSAAQGSGSNVDLKTTRKAIDLGIEKWLTPSLLFEASFKNEEKNGARIFGRGFNCSAAQGCVTAGANSDTFGAILLLPEPIDAVTRQFEAKLNYADDKLAVNGGYYGSFYTNRFGSLNQTFAGRLWQPNGAGFDPTNATGNSLQTAMGVPLALPPDNQSHQLSLAGTYAFTPSTRATFKYSYTHGTQKESFAGMGMGGTNGGPRGALDGVVDTAVGQVGLTSRPIQNLTLLANLRYEAKSDKTPIDRYRSSTVTGIPLGQPNTNSPGSHVKIKGKLEASYQLPAGYRATAGIDYDFRDLGRPTGTNDTSGQATAIRAKNNEIGYRAELRKSLSENLNGAVSAGHSFRNGSKWMTATNGTAPTTAEGTLQGTGFNLFPLFWMDLSRDKLKGSLDWTVAKDLTLQASLDVAAEHYYAPTMRGARDGASNGVNLDAAYTLSDNWKMNGWYTRSDTILDVNGSTGAYMAGLRQLGHTLGVGLRGAPSSKVEVGADFSFSYEVNRTATGVIGTTTQANALPAAAFRQLNLNIFSKYALDKNADIRVSLLHQRYYSNEWFWNNNGVSFFYSDGTTVTQKDQQNVTYLGATYIYKFQ